MLYFIFVVPCLHNIAAIIVTKFNGYTMNQILISILQFYCKLSKKLFT